MSAPDHGSSSDAAAPSPSWMSWLGFGWTILRWPVAVGVIGWLVYQNVYLNAGELTSRSIAWWAVGLAVASYTVALLITYFRWFMLVRAQEFDFTYSDAVRLGLVGMLFNFVAPGSVGGDVVKGAMIAKQQKARRLVAASTVFLDRCLGTLGLFIVGVFAFLILPPEYKAGLAWMAWLFVAGIVIGTLGLVVALWPPVTGSRWVVAMTEWRYVGRVIGGTLRAVQLYQAKWRTVVNCVLLSLVGHMCMLSTFYFCSSALARGSAVPGYRPQLVFGAGSNFIQAFVPTPGGAGAFESVYAAGFHTVDGLKIDHLRETLPTGSPPPEWRAALGAMLESKNDGSLDHIAEENDATPADVRSTVAAIHSGKVPAATAFATGHDGVPAATVWSVYRAGHTGMAFREGLLAALGFRVLTVLVAIIGAVIYFVSRREIDTAMEEKEAADRAATAEREPIVRSA